MKFQGVLVSLGVLACCCCSLGSAVECTSMESIKNAQTHCFREHGVDVDPTNMDKIQGFIHNDHAATCQNRRGFAGGLRCALKVDRDCVQSLGQDPDILPDPAKVKHGLDYLCDNIHNVDSPCVNEQIQPMKECALTREKLFLSANPDTDIRVVACKVFDITVECVREKLAQCVGQTREVITHYFHHYALPPACKNSVQPDPGYAFATVAPMAPKRFAPMAPMAPKRFATMAPKSVVSSALVIVASATLVTVAAVVARLFFVY